MKKLIMEIKIDKNKDVIDKIHSTLASNFV